MIFDVFFFFSPLLLHLSTPSSVRCLVCLVEMDKIKNAEKKSTTARWNIGYVKIVNCFSHEQSIGRKTFKRRTISMAVPSASRAALETSTTNAPKAHRRRKHSSGWAPWAMCRWLVKRQIHQLYQVNYIVSCTHVHIHKIKLIKPPFVIN